MTKPTNEVDKPIQNENEQQEYIPAKRGSEEWIERIRKANMGNTSKLKHGRYYRPPKICSIECGLNKLGLCRKFDEYKGKNCYIRKKMERDIKNSLLDRKEFLSQRVNYNRFCLDSGEEIAEDVTGFTVSSTAREAEKNILNLYNKLDDINLKIFELGVDEENAEEEANS